MIRVTTIYAASAGASARYYTGCLTEQEGELPGRWTGRQASTFGLSGEVSTEALELLLSGRHPITGQVLGRELLDRVDRHGNVTKAVAGYDATFSAPKSLSVLWALTGDDGLAECHDRAVDAAVAMIEKFGSTTRIRSNGTRLHPDTGGLTAAVFRQSTSRADDPLLHTHVVISAKVQTDDGRWWALDARLLKRHQQTFGYVYQSVLRAELTTRYGVVFDEIVNGQAEIAGMPTELLHQFSKRAHVIAVEMDERIADFMERTGQEPTDGEYAAMEREAAADTRDHKTGLSVADLRSRWDREAESVGYDAIDLVDSVRTAAREHVAAASPVTVAEVLEELAERRSTWNRMDVLRTLAGTARPQPGHDASSWAKALEAGADTVLDACIDLDPAIGTGRRRGSDGRSLLIEPVANQATSEHVLAQEERIITWAIDAQLDDPAPSSTITDTDLDDGQRAAAGAVAGDDRLVLVVGPAGAGKTRMLAAAVDDLHNGQRPVIGVAPTGKGAAVLARETGVAADTIAKFLRDLDQPTAGATWWDPGPGARRSSSTKPAWPEPPTSTASSTTPNDPDGDSCSSATPTSSKPSAAAACSPNSARPDTPSNSTDSTASNTHGKPPRRCASGPATAARWPPTPRSVASDPAPSTNTSTPSPTNGNGPTRPGRRCRSPPPATNTSPPSTTTSRTGG